MSQRRSSKKANAKKRFCPKVEDLECRLAPATGFLAYPTYMRPLGEPYNGGSPSPVGFTPPQIRTAYAFNSIIFGGTVGDGSGQTIAIVDAYDDPSFVNSTDPTFASSDLAKFDQQFGIPDPPSFMKVNQLGQTTNLPPTDPAGAGNSNWEGEEALDVEWAHSMAPKANIILVECNTPGPDLDVGEQTAASLPGVSVVSNSWGAGEYAGEAAAEDSSFLTPTGHQGVTFLASTGDNGWPGGYPAYSPNVVAVGGTSLFLNADNSYNTETGWGNGPNSGSLGGSGGGTSQYEPEPAFQQSVQSTGFRTIPDVSFVADPNTGVTIYDSYNNTDGSGPWTQIGGTSLACPCWAALIAIADQGRVLEGGTTLNGQTQTLPDLYSLPKTDFHDILIGNNGGFSCGPGYDEVTGIGSPIANLVAQGLSGFNIETVTPATIPGGSVGVGYHQVITGSQLSGTTTMTETITGGTLPAGLSMSIHANTVVISGTPTQAGSVNFTVTAVNTVAGVATRSYTLTISGPVSILTSSLPPATAGIYYDQDIVAVGGNGVNTWGYQVTSGALPSGLSFVTSASTLDFTLSGTPQTGGTVTFLVTVVDSVGAVGSKSLTLTIYPAFTLVPASLPLGTVGHPYLDSTGANALIVAQGGSNNYTLTYYITSGSVPPGLNIAATSKFIEVYGTPTTAGIANLHVVASDAAGATATQDYVLNVSTGFSLSPANIPPAIVGNVYNQAIIASGGVGAMAVSYSIPSGYSIDPGLSFTATGSQLLISGTPTFANSIPIQVTAVDSATPTQHVVTHVYTLVTEPAFTLNQSGLPGATVAQLYNQAIGVNNSPYPYKITYTITSPGGIRAIPSGMILYVTSSGLQLAVTGTPAAVGSVSFYVTATDTLNPAISTTQSYTLSAAPAVRLSLQSLPGVTLGYSYNQNISVSGGTGGATISYAITAGTIPSGMAITTGPSTVSITGRPVAAGNTTLTVTAVDSVGASVTQSYSLNVNSPPSWSRTGIPQSTVGVPYNQVITAVNGTGPVAVYLTVLSGAMPRGMAFRAYPSGLQIVGTPVVAGNVVFRLTARDFYGATIVANYTLVINPPISFSRSTLPVDPVGVGYAQAILAYFGTGYKTTSYTILSGSIPSGLNFQTLPNELLISGKPTVNQTVVFRVIFTDQVGATASEVVTLIT
jgi:subtilase family serine protease